MKDELHDEATPWRAASKMVASKPRTFSTSAVTGHPELRRGKQTPLQDVVKTGEQMGNGFFGFVAHIRETKGFASDLAIASVDDEMMS
jgi:hypothetical protein